MEKTRIQVCSEKARAVYANDLGTPLLQQLCLLHNLSIREFAEIFDISKSHAEDVIKERIFPPLAAAIAISRYFEVDVEFLFGWRVDDNGARRPLLIEVPGSKTLVRLKVGDPASSSKALVEARAEWIRKQKEEGF